MRQQRKIKRRFQFSLFALMVSTVAFSILFIASHAIYVTVLDVRENARRTSCANNFHNYSHACHRDGSCPICREIENR